MPDLDFQVIDAQCSSGVVNFLLRITNRIETEPVDSIALRCQVQIEAPRYRYNPREKEKLRDLFGELDRWSESLRSMLWTNVTLNIPAFTGSIDQTVTVPHTPGATKYFHALEGSEVPITFLFSGRIFYHSPEAGLQFAPIPWSKEARYRFPIHLYRGDVVEKIARAVLYEGYILYPYRRSALKNRHRWNFGVLYPESYDRSYFQLECLALGPLASIDLSIRFLHIVCAATGAEAWETGIERTAELPHLTLETLAAQPHKQTFSWEATEQRQETLHAEIEISATPLPANLFRLSVRVQNTTPLDNREDRGEALLRSLASAHAVLRIRNGEFVSQTDPPNELREAVDACTNTGVWPVLVGEPGVRDTILASPIILSDYPQVAPESPDDLFDSTEIDEILSLRILTLTDDEKAEMRQTDERARRILDRIESNPAEHLARLHGAIRFEPPPQTLSTSGCDLKKGDRVRLRPKKRADAFDILLDGKIGIIEAIEQDFEDNVHVAVVLEDDPGRDLGEMRQAGHRFFFSASEIEPEASP